VWTDAPNHDSDTRDPNALDVIVGPGQTQAQVLDWLTAFPTRVPMLGLTLPADTVAPTVSAALDPASPDGDGIYRVPVKVTLSGADDRPGVTLEYRINGSDWLAYSAPFVIGADGVYLVEYRATDAAGNRSEIGSNSFRIDQPNQVDTGIVGAVPATLSLTLGGPATFGAFLPGVARDYSAATTATVTSTAGDATLTVADLSGTLTGRLVNGAFALAQPVQVRAGGAGAFAPVGAATPLMSWNGPVSGQVVQLGFRQSIGAAEALRTGSYGKTLTFTLSTTTP
jgi:hypothetical protein